MFHKVFIFIVIRGIIELKSMNNYGITTYNIRKNPKYKNIIDTMESFNTEPLELLSPTDSEDLIISSARTLTPMKK